MPTVAILTSLWLTALGWARPEVALAQALARERAISVRAEPAAAFEHELRGPDGSMISHASCGETVDAAAPCEVGAGWWRGPGPYTLAVCAGDTRSEVRFELTGTELSVVANVAPGPHVRLAIDRHEPKVRARIDPRTRRVILVNETSRDLRLRGLHDAYDGTIPWRVVDEARERSEPPLAQSGQHGACGNARETISLPAFAMVSRWTLQALFPGLLETPIAPGAYVGEIHLEAWEVDGDIDERWVATFAVQVRVETTAPGGLSLAFPSGPAGGRP